MTKVWWVLATINQASLDNFRASFETEDEADEYVRQAVDHEEWDWYEIINIRERLYD